MGNLLKKITGKPRWSLPEKRFFVRPQERSGGDLRRTHRNGRGKAHAHAAHVHRHHHNGTETSHLAFSLPQTSTCSVGWSYHSARRAICQVLFSLERENFVFLRKLKIVLDKSAACHYNDSCKPRWTVSSAGMSTCLTCMGSQVRVLYCPPSSRTKKDIYAKNPEVSTASGFFCAHFLKLEKKISVSVK